MDHEVFEFRGLNVLDSKCYKVVVEDGVISDLSECKTAPEGSYFCPGGLIDTQVNGCLGYNYTGEDLSVSQVRQICMELAKHGTLQHFATIITSSEERILKSLDTLVKAIEEDEFVRRSITGIHIEAFFSDNATKAASLKQESLSFFILSIALSDILKTELGISLIK